MRLQLKFKNGASAAARDVVVAKLASDGANVAPVFPDTTDPHLGSIYTVEVGGGSETKLLKLLNHEDAVEIAEPEVRRRLAAQ